MVVGTDVITSLTLVTPHLMQIMRELKEGREIVYGYMGVMVSTPTERDRQIAGVPEPIGVRVDGVEGDSPASESAKIKEHDVIVQINGEIVRDSDQFVRVIMTVADGGARGVMRGHQSLVHDVELSDTGVLRDIDTQQDLDSG